MTDVRFTRRYELRDRLGTGRFGEVWLAHDHNLGINVALKLIRNPSDATEAILEARRLKELESDRILRVLDADIVEAGDFAYVATELAAGGSTEDQLRAGGYIGLRPDHVVTWVRQTLIGLTAAHAHGFIHRDAKPGNIFLAGPERAALGDFGSAAPMDADGTVGHGGDPLVRAPEMLKSARSDVRADVYSMGVATYRLLTGRWPVEDPDFSVFKGAVLHARYPDLRDLAPHVPDALGRIVRRAMQVRSEDRFPTPAAMYGALGRLRLTSAWQPVTPHPGDLRCWIQHVTRGHTPHHVCVAQKGVQHSILTKRASGAQTRVLALCLDGVPKARLPRELRRAFGELDRALA